MRALYPPIEPDASGWLDVGDGQSLYWEACGNPDGKPVVVLHGGPGSGCTPTGRRYFDPARYRIILFDQRGCGRSRPLASDYATDLSVNTTTHLIADIERLRAHLRVARWMIFGGSWGSTLALSYAQAHPARVTEMILMAVATTTRAEIDWITRGVRLLLPDAWEKFYQGAPAATRDQNLAEAYRRLLNDPDPAIRAKAARDWCDWEIALISLHADVGPQSRYDDPTFRYGFARMVTHYWAHAAWLDDGALLKGIARIAHIPAILIHGRLDIGSPLVTAWTLAQAWPSSELVIVNQAGHDARDPGMFESVVAATDRFAGRV